MLKLNANRAGQWAKRVAQAGRLLYHVSGDAFRFWRYASLSAFDAGYDQVCARIVYNVHALEKGLAQTDGWVAGRGRKALRNLNDALTIYRLCAFWVG